MLPLPVNYIIRFILACCLLRILEWTKSYPIPAFDIKLGRWKIISLQTKADIEFRSNVFVVKGKWFKMRQARVSRTQLSRSVNWSDELSFPWCPCIVPLSCTLCFSSIVCYGHIVRKVSWEINEIKQLINRQTYLMLTK